MKNRNSFELLSDLLAINDELSELLEKRIIPLRKDQKLWKSAADKWNILECFAHLNRFTFYYLPTIETKISKADDTEPEANYTSSHLGRQLYRGVRLNKANKIKRKFKSQRGYNPLFNKDLVQNNDDEVFLERQSDLKKIINKAQQSNLRKIKLPILFSKVVKIRLGDALLYLAHHNRRHVYQALSIIEDPNFPK